MSGLAAVAERFSPRYETYGTDQVVVDASGLDRLIGSPAVVAGELVREAAACGVRAHVAVARTGTAARLLATARPGVTIADGSAAAAVAPLPVAVLATWDVAVGFGRPDDVRLKAEATVAAFNRWGLKTLGEIAALPPADLAARLGGAGRVWQALARGEDLRPLVPDRPDERFEASLELEWPIEGLEPLSFVVTRLVEPLSLRLEARDRGAARLHTELRLVTKEVCSRSLDLPAPMRDVRTLRTLLLLDLESHPPGAAIDRVSIVIDPTPGRIVQHTLFARPHPTPEQLSTLVARLGALMGQDRIGAPATVDSYRPGAFTLRPFDIEHDDPRGTDAGAACGALRSAVRRFRRPVPARVAVAGGRPVRVTTDRAGLSGGGVRAAAGPWRTSGSWWADGAARWSRDEWDVSLADEGVYCVFQDRHTGRWYVEGIVD